MTLEFPPRGSGVRGRLEEPPSTSWASPEGLGGEWTWSPGKILLGCHGSRLIGLADDRHLVTIAQTRSGKSASVLKHNLERWPGSVVVTDPKGELFAATAAARAAMGQRVFRMSPFDETMGSSAKYNPFSELGYGNGRLVPADAALAADALIVPNERDPHWTDSARNLIRGIVLHLISERGGVTLRLLRDVLASTHAELDELLGAMADSDAYDGVVSNIGRAFLAKFTEGSREFASIMSTAQEQTAPLDDVREISDASDFQLADLSKGGMTIYLVLPGLRIPTHFRWLRIMVQAALGAVERYPVPRGETSVLFMLEEFAALGHMRSIETAAGLLAGAGVKLWTVLQDLGQLKRDYPKSWETFLGNAGVIQAFANADPTTTEYLSRMLGTTQVVERQNTRLSSASMRQGDNGVREQLRSVPLLDSSEISRFFARETGRQLVLVPGCAPLYMQRMKRHEK